MVCRGMFAVLRWAPQGKGPHAQEERGTLGFQPRDGCSIVAEAEVIQSSCRYPIMPGPACNTGGCNLWCRGPCIWIMRAR
jgi:hypothetical protein